MKYGKEVTGRDVVSSIPEMLQFAPINEGVVGEVQTVKKSEVDIANDIQLQSGEDAVNNRHMRDLEDTAKAMSVDEQRATARGLDPRVMIDEIAHTLVEQNKKIRAVQSVVEVMDL